MQTIAKHSQTQASHKGVFGLPMLQASPYYDIGSGGLIPKCMINAYVLNLKAGGSEAAVDFLVEDSTGVNTGCASVVIGTGNTDTAASIVALVNGAITTFATNNIGISLDSITWLAQTTIAAAAGTPSSYQTIVSQTGTSAPAVSGLTPTSTYPSGTTFTWARTGTGVYTLTASTAVFNTSGKTGVFVGSLNNLNASYKTVVTSTTVITITTAIGSLLGLGLLGLTATNTDALLSNTMIYVQTYA